MELLRDRSPEFREAGVRPFGVSGDSEWTHIAWAQALDLNFPLLSDWNK
jgi:peroxiredoxin